MPSLHEVHPNGKPQLSPITAAAVSLIARGFRVVSLHGIIQPGTYGQGKRVITIDKPQCACVAGAKCKHPGKHPRFKNWENGCTSLDEINRTWMSEDNIGILTGEESGIFVLDIDPRHGGDESLIELITKFGRIGYDLEATTGGGGRHLYFQHPGRPVPTVAGILPGIDVRGEGGLVVAPPSMHISGRRYTWDGITEFNARLGQACPRLTELVCGKKNRPTAAIAAIAASAPSLIRDGEKHDYCIKSSGAMRHQGFTEDQIFSALRDSHFESYVSDEDLRGYAQYATYRWNTGNSEDHIVTNRDGTPKALVSNAITTLKRSTEWRGALSRNEFHNQIEAIKMNPSNNPSDEKFPRVWTDEDDILAAAWLQRQGVHVTKEIAAQAIRIIAMENSYHPVRDYLGGLKWDGKQRVKAWLNQYLGADHNDYSSAVGERWLISAVARVHEPGCKVDCCLILEGPQGIKKSTALRIMGDPWFTDEMPTLGTKDAAIQCQGKWIIEMSELESMSRAELGRIKAFISRSTDDFRPVWEKHSRPFPRQCVFSGSGNKSTYLPDETGNRRFWPIRCSNIRADELARDKDQLWAETLWLYRNHHTWWLDTPELRRLAKAEQAERYEEDPWHEGIARWLEPRTENVSLEDVIRECTNKPRDQWTQDVKNRVARTLLALGWERYQIRIGGQRCWRYRRYVSP